MNDTELRIRAFVVQNFYVPSSDIVTEHTSLLETGLVDSTGILEVLAFLEQTFAIHIDDDEILPENLDTVQRIATFVARKQAGAT